MAKTLTDTGIVRNSSDLTLSLQSVLRLRLVTGFVALLGALLFFLGTSWDIQWHSFVGRDRTLIPPHEIMLTGVALSGIAALVAVLIETLWARRNVAIAQNSTRFADAFSSPLGAYVVGFAALNAALAFPLDAYWHALYGIDVEIWAPFHIMFIVGMALVALGALYILASTARLAERVGDLLIKRAGYIGAIIAWACMLSIFAFLLFDALDESTFIHLGGVTMTVFPVLAALLVPWVLVSARLVVPWRWTATSIVGISFVLVVIVALYVPPATDLLVKLEHLSYRKDGHVGVSVVAAEWPLLTSLIVAILIDVVTMLARRRSWSATRQSVALVLASVIVCLPLMPIRPQLTLNMIDLMGIAGFGVSLLLGLLGVWAGTWFGQRMGAAILHTEGGV